MNKLYFGDNLEIMREMEAESIDLICTDPPFNSGRNYNAFFTESKAQSKAYTDIWKWDDAAEKSRDDIRKLAGASDTYKALDACLQGYDLMLQNAVKGNKGSMRAYLAFMGPRLAEMHRLLKDTGSIYLHCDPTASHYLKGVMDAIWDQKNLKKNEHYRNEIMWCYTTPSTPYIRQFVRCTDTILFYSKGKKWTFNRDDVRVPYKGGAPHGGKKWATSGESLSEWRKRKSKEGKIPENWWTIPKVIRKSDEDLEYPTQKPITLYERMIKASSNKGDLVMDPFCGCGTTIDAAHTLKRFWVGIDLTIIALDPISKRMGDRHVGPDGTPLTPHKGYEIIGYPTNMQEVYKLVRDEKKRHDFSNWAVTRLGMTPTSDVGDGGKDGVGHVALWNPDTEEDTPRRILAEVKTGKPTIAQVRAFCHTMDEQEAVAGIFITLKPVTRGMRQIAAADMGKFEHINNQQYDRLQFWQIDDDYFQNSDILEQRIKLPRNWIQPRKKSERHFEDRQMTLLG